MHLRTICINTLHYFLIIFHRLSRNNFQIEDRISEVKFLFFGLLIYKFLNKCKQLYAVSTKSIFE